MCARRCVSVPEGVYVCQVCMCARRCVCVPGHVYVCQEVCIMSGGVYVC